MPLTYHWQRLKNPMSEKFNTYLTNSFSNVTDVLTSSSYDKDEVWENSQSVEDKLIVESNVDKEYISAVSLYHFQEESPYRKICYNLKYKGQKDQAQYFATILAEKIKVADFLKDVDLIIPVPLHWTRRLKRGYNQSEVIAKALSSVLGVQMRTDLLYRRKRTKTQTALNVEEKLQNVQNAFFCKPLPVVNHILIVDDVFTTGATLYNCVLAAQSSFRLSAQSFDSQLFDNPSFHNKLSNNQSYNEDSCIKPRISIATLASV